MTLAQFVSTVRRRNNAEGDSNWSDAEIYELISHRCNEALSHINVLEQTDVQLSVADQSGYTVPTDAGVVQEVIYDNERMKRVTRKYAELFYNQGAGVTSGRPQMYYLHAARDSTTRTIYLVPAPQDSSVEISVWSIKEHPYIDGSSQTTIDIPSILHAHLVPGVLADMYAKDLNVQLMQYYENKWQGNSIPAFLAYAAKYHTGGDFQVLGDSDSGTVYV